jgi:DNA end-binding protein Ku
MDVMAARSIASATISFGLVSIPIKLYTAASSNGVSFNMLHKKCGTRVKQQYVCPFDKEVVERADMVKGYEYAKGQFVQMTDEELQSLQGEKTDRLDIVEFVPAQSLDLVYIDTTYYLGPGKGGDRAYKLLSEAMERAGKIALGRFGARGREQLVALRPYKGGLSMHPMHYADEVRSMDDVERPGQITFKPIEEELADKLIEELSSTEFRPEQYHNDYRDRVLGAIEQKAAGHEITAVPEQPQAQIIDLFEALKRSLAEKAHKNAPAASAGSAAGDAPASAGEVNAVKPITKADAHRGSREKTPAVG